MALDVMTLFIYLFFPGELLQMHLLLHSSEYDYRIILVKGIWLLVWCKILLAPATIV